MVLKLYKTSLILEDEKVYSGWSFFNSISTIGEVVFNTGMTGYQEVLTDPSYYNQIILFTYPEIGNTGVNILDMESIKPSVRGLIAKNICLSSSNWRSEISLVNYLFKYKIPHIFGIDTRDLTKYLRNRGVMSGMIMNYRFNFSFVKSKIEKFKLDQQLAIVSHVTTKKNYKWSSNLLKDLQYKFSIRNIDQRQSLKIIVIDYGLKFNILNRLIFYGCSILVVPANTNYKIILEKEPDGILLSNGPGDPSVMYDSIKNIQELVKYNIPIFGICLGHQLLSIAFGAETNKLKFGHRGLNHPSGLSHIVKITSQNHGYVVSMQTIPKTLMRMVDFNLNDLTLSGIVHKYKPYFSVQYHPEASPGPHDADYLFLNFLKIILLFK